MDLRIVIVSLVSLREATSSRSLVGASSESVASSCLMAC